MTLVSTITILVALVSGGYFDYMISESSVGPADSLGKKWRRSREEKAEAKASRRPGRKKEEETETKE